MLTHADRSSLSPWQAAVGFKGVGRKEAIAADRASEHAESLSEVWRGLTCGKTKVVDHFLSDDRCYVVLASAQVLGAREQLCPRKIEMLESIFLEGNPKSVAADWELTLSSVATLTKQGLASMGILCTPWRVPPQFVMAAFAAKGVAQGEQARLSQLEVAGLPFWVNSVRRPDAELSALLSPAEYTVTRLFVEGKTHSEIARLRRTSTRTVANQLAAVFHRLGVSGRLRLLGKLTMHAAALSHPH
jgi:DNA-binding CsgD family transcriptional regulator